MGSWRGPGHQKNQAVIRSFKLSALYPHSLERGQGLKVEFMVDYAYMMEPPQTSPKVQHSGNFWAGGHVVVLGEWLAWRGPGSSVPLPTHLALCISSIWLFLSYVLLQ